LDVSITPNQNLILCGIDQTWREPITNALAQAGLLVRVHFCVAYAWFIMMVCINFFLILFTSSPAHTDTVVLILLLHYTASI
jgi:hypothetical protein